MKKRSHAWVPRALYIISCLAVSSMAACSGEQGEAYRREAMMVAVQDLLEHHDRTSAAVIMLPGVYVLQGGVEMSTEMDQLDLEGAKQFLTSIFGNQYGLLEGKEIEQIVQESCHDLSWTLNAKTDGFPVAIVGQREWSATVSLLAEKNSSVPDVILSTQLSLVRNREVAFVALSLYQTCFAYVLKNEDGRWLLADRQIVWTE